MTHSIENLDRRARQRHPKTVDGYQPSAYRSLAASNLDDDHLMSLMSKLLEPDLPGLPALVIRQLSHPGPQLSFFAGMLPPLPFAFPTHQLR